jgi:hypothetical protein
MKKYIVTLSHIVGYYPEDENGDCEPKLKLTEIEVIANDKKEAIKKANELDITKWSVYECYISDEFEL